MENFFFLLQMLTIFVCKPQGPNDASSTTIWNKPNASAAVYDASSEQASTRDDDDDDVVAISTNDDYHAPAAEQDIAG